MGLGVGEGVGVGDGEVVGLGVGLGEGEGLGGAAVTKFWARIPQELVTVEPGWLINWLLTLQLYVSSGLQLPPETAGREQTVFV